MSDIVIVGGGIVGAATSYYAHRRGATCTIVERDGIASHASGFAFGGLHPRVLTSTGSEMPQFARQSFEEHRVLHEQLQSDNVANSTWRKRISVALAFTSSEAEQLRTHKRDSDTTQWLDSHDLRQLEPRLSHHAIGGLLSENSAEVDAAELTRTLCELSDSCVKLDKVIGLELSGDRIQSVKTRGGETLHGDSFVFAMGPWTDEISTWLHVPKMILALKGQILRVSYAGPRFSHSFSTNGNYMSSKPDGLVWVGTTEESDPQDELPSIAARNEILRVLQSMVPTLEDVEVVQQTACFRPRISRWRSDLRQTSRIQQRVYRYGWWEERHTLWPANGKIPC